MVELHENHIFFQYVAKLGEKTGGRRTLVYPKVLREAVRQRFGDDPEAGAYDDQFQDKVN